MALSQGHRKPRAWALLACRGAQEPLQGMGGLNPQAVWAPSLLVRGGNLSLSLPGSGHQSLKVSKAANQHLSFPLPPAQTTSTVLSLQLQHPPGGMKEPGSQEGHLQLGHAVPPPATKHFALSLLFCPWETALVRLVTRTQECRDGRFVVLFNIKWHLRQAPETGHPDTQSQ